VTTTITTGFDVDQHRASGNGWVNSYTDGSGAIVSTQFATLTLAQAAAQDLFSDDPTIHGALQEQARVEFLAVPANVTTVDTNTTTLRTAEGLDGPYP